MLTNTFLITLITLLWFIYAHYTIHTHLIKVDNPSASNDEGITALHNAICAGHVDIMRYLINIPCDINARDSDGWFDLL